MENQQSSEEMQNKLNEWNEGKDNNNNQSAINNREPQQDALTIEISGFCNQILIIHEAKVYNTECLNKKDLILAISGINKNFSGDIKVDGISIKNNRYIAKYLQSSSLILTQQTFLHPNLTLQQNLKIISLMYANYDLSQATMSSFSMKEFANTKIKNLPKNKKQLAVLSLSVACPAMLWVVDKSLLSGLTKEEMALWENVVKIRTKHGGAIVLM
ncbi:MAG: ATP-binding cassette domain-containing protein [Rickettsiales bacterium]|nr:ATP-binding cassette domain-containing protein [Rickettsiales bacterium]